MDSQEELFAVLRADGVRTANCAMKKRSDVHRDGTWHAAVHVWILAERGNEDEGEKGPFLLLQKRADTKER